MKQYIYKSEDAGLAEWPSGTLRLEGIEVTTDPNQADVFVCPGNIRIFESSPGLLGKDKLRRLPYFRGNESRHVFFDVSDNFTQSIHMPIIFIRCDVRSWMMPHDVNTIQMAWPVKDYADCVEVPQEGFTSDISFHGWVSSLTRRVSMESCISSVDLKYDIRPDTRFFGYIKDQEEITRLDIAFRQSMRQSRIALCPESIAGVFPYRYWEAMSAGRVPLLVGSDFVYPFQDEIDYDAFTIKLARADAPDAGKVALDFVRNNSDEEIIRRGRLAREAWVRWLDSRNWPKLMAYAVEKHLARIAA